MLDIAPAAFETQVRVTDQQLAAFFEPRKEEFRTAEEVALKFVEFSPQSYVDQVTFDDAELDGALGDAFFEVGRYPEAFLAYDRFVAARPCVR